MKEYRSCADLRFEIQIRSLIQDAWSSIDHRIKYKKSISPDLRRRVNALAALFEIAEREFREIRDATLIESLSYQNSYESIEKETEREEVAPVGQFLKPAARLLDVFSFLRIARHFFPDFIFEDRRVDGFVVEIMEREPRISPGKFNHYMKTTISRVKRYAEDFRKSKGSSMNAFTMIRHCLFLSDPGIFDEMLTQNVKDNFQQWLQAQE